jgi:hypothetical protein
MNLKFSGVGAEPKKIAVLVGLGAIAGYFYFSNSNSGDSATPAPVSTVQPAAGPRAVARPGGRAAVRVTQKGLNQTTREFKPSFKFSGIDPSNIDPTLHLNLLAKLQDVKVEAGARSLFEIGKEPVAEVKLTGKEPGPIAVVKPFVGPKPPPDPPPPPPDPKAPPIPLKFYGFVNPSKATNKRAFFLDGEDIIIAGEGDMVKKRYKIVRIGVNSAVVEDTQFKSNNQQTLPLEAEMAG